jgi:hypothetical protein
MNTFIHRLTERLFVGPGMLHLVIRLIIVGLLAAGCAAPMPPSPAALTDSAATTDSTAAPAPEAEASSAPVCDESTPSVLAVWGGGNNDPNFESITNDFVASAASWEFSATPSPAAADFAQAMNQHTIGFYTGHGTPTGFDLHPSVGSTVTITSLPALGQCDDSTQDQLRYLMLASCNTFAHGPKENCSDPNAQDYACPGEWQYDPAGDTEAMRSIYARWGPALGNGLRMACGMTTDAPPENANGFWSEYGLRSVADAIVASLSLQNDVAMCIARGGLDFADSPLMQDTSFISATNTDDDGAEVYYHLQYAKPFAYPYQPVHGMLVGEDQVEAQLTLFETISESFPECLPVLETPPSETQRNGDPSNQEPSLTPYASEAEALEETNPEQYVNDYALQGLDDLGLGNPDVDGENTYASGIYLMTTTFPADPAQQNQEALRVAVKNVIITFPQLFALNEIPGIEDLGRPQDLERLNSFYDNMRERFDDSRWAAPQREGQPLVRLWGRYIRVQLNTNGSPISGSSGWQPIEGIQAIGSEQVLTPADAFVRSLVQLGYGTDEESPYRLESWEWGYARSQPGSPASIRYRFRFGPHQAAGYDASTHPPVYQWVDGRAGESCPPE